MKLCISSGKVFAKDLPFMMMSSSGIRPIQSQFGGINQKLRGTYLSKFTILVASLFYASGYCNDCYFQKKDIKRVRIWWNFTSESTCH